MRLSLTHRWPSRLFLSIVGIVTGAEPVDVLKCLHYRSELWGRAYSDLLHDVMCGPSEWTRGERELFAAWTAKLNDCEF